MAPVDATSWTLRKIIAWPRSGRVGTILASPASTTVRIENGSTPSWSEFSEPTLYCASRMARGPNRAPERWVTMSSKGAPTMATSTPRALSSAGSVTQGSFENVDGPTYGGRWKSGNTSHSRSQPFPLASAETGPVPPGDPWYGLSDALVRGVLPASPARGRCVTRILRGLPEAGFGPIAFRRRRFGSAVQRGAGG